MNEAHTASAALVAASGLALYAAHHVGDYWVQTDHQAAHKGDAGSAGRLACLRHVATYVLTQGLALAMLAGVIGGLPMWPTLAALAVSGGTHYLADRRTHGLMFAVVRWLEPIAGKASFMKLGVPRAGRTVTAHGAGWKTEEVPLDSPSLGTGAWALDQAWHIALGVFVPALIIGAFA